MTATISENTGTEHKEGGVGRVSRIIGPVVDIEFPVDAMPALYNLLSTEVANTDGSEGTSVLNLEVAQHIGDTYDSDGKLLCTNESWDCLIYDGGWGGPGAGGRGNGGGNGIASGILGGLVIGSILDGIFD